jgi:hypothetical protein
MNKLLLSVIFAISSVSLHAMFDEGLLDKALAPDKALAEAKKKAEHEALEAVAEALAKQAKASAPHSPCSSHSPSPQLSPRDKAPGLEDASARFQRPIGPVNAPKTPDRPWKKAYLNRKNGAYVATAVAAAWATYAACQVAKNVPQQEWDNLSTIQKCKLVAQGTLPEMLSQAQRAVSYCTGR